MWRGERSSEERWITETRICDIGGLKKPKTNQKNPKQNKTVNFGAKGLVEERKRGRSQSAQSEQIWLLDIKATTYDLSLDDNHVTIDERNMMVHKTNVRPKLKTKLSGENDQNLKTHHLSFSVCVQEPKINRTSPVF